MGQASQLTQASDTSRWRLCVPASGLLWDLQFVRREARQRGEAQQHASVAHDPLLVPHWPRRQCRPDERDELDGKELPRPAARDCGGGRHLWLRPLRVLLHVPLAHFFPGDTSRLLLILALGTSLPMILGFFFICPIPLLAGEG